MRPEDMLSEIKKNHLELDIEVKLYEKEISTLNDRITQALRFIEAKENEFRQNYNKYSDLFKIDIDLLRAYDLNAQMVNELMRAVQDVIQQINRIMVQTRTIFSKFDSISQQEQQYITTIQNEISSMREKWRTAEEMLQEFIILQEEQKKEIRTRAEPEQQEIEQSSPPIEQLLEDEEDLELDDEDIEEIEKLIEE